MSKYSKLIAQEELIIRNFKLNISSFLEQIKYHEDLLLYYKEQTQLEK